MALLLDKLYLNKEYSRVYVNIDVVNVHQGNTAEVFLSYWRDSSKKEKLWGDVVTVPFNKSSNVNLYTQIYNALKNNNTFIASTNA